MTDEQIIQKFKDTYERYKEKGDFRTPVYFEVLDLIKRREELIKYFQKVEKFAHKTIALQEEEIKKLKAEIFELKKENEQLQIKNSDFFKMKSEAYKEFAERFNELLKEYAPYDTFHIYEIKDRIDIVEEELTEGGNEDGTNHS